MGSSVKPKSITIYGSLLRLYPQSFQRHYGATMVQTFDDLLDGEQSRSGRLRVWARTLVDLPISAAKEHLTNGKDLTMNRNTKLILAGTTVVIILVGLGSFWAGNLFSRQSVGIEQVTVAQLADAMQQDYFYSSYGDAAMLFSGKVASVEARNGASLVTFTTNRPYGVTCQFPKVVTTKVGQTISVAAPGGSAERQAHGVLLHNCIEN
jgi:hypothetical protein